MENKGKFIENAGAREFIRLRNVIPLLELYYYREKSYEIDFKGNGNVFLTDLYILL